MASVVVDIHGKVHGKWALKVAAFFLRRFGVKVQIDNGKWERMPLTVTVGKGDLPEPRRPDPGAP